MRWPEEKRFAFTIIDDTDWSFVHNIKPVYDLLYDLNMKTTKTVWVYPPRDHFNGQCLQDESYLEFIRDLQAKGFQFALHHVGSGSFSRAEIIEGLEIFRSLLGEYPSIHANHSRNPDKLYWGYKRFVFPFSTVFRLVSSRNGSRGTGEDPSSPYFWGDAAKEKIKYFRNLVFNGINTESYDWRMPYIDPRKQSGSNYWFSSSNAPTLRQFNDLLTKENVDRLEAEKGYCIAYTHFASGFVDKNGDVDRQFEDQIRYLASRPGWFVPARTLLDYLSETRAFPQKIPRYPYFFILNLRWMIDRVAKRLKYQC